MLKWLLGLITGLALWGCYNLGGIDKQNEIIYNCRDYGKHVIDESWQITCTGPFNPMLLLPEYKPYPQELKDKHRKDRK